MVNQKSLDSVVNGNNKLAFDLYARYKSEEGNVFFSPYSISTALAMTYEGAKGKTADEMLKVLHFPKVAKTRREGFAGLYKEVNSEGKKYEMNTANALWAQKDFEFLKKYFSLVEKYYNGNVTNLDFVNETEPSRLVINGWVEKETKDKIRDLIPSGSLNEETRLVLTNAIYFKGTWLKQFNKEHTKEKDFVVSSEKTIKAQMMSLTGDGVKFNYAENDTMQMLELPYDGKELSMLVLLPKKPSDLENMLSSEKLEGWKKGLHEEEVGVYLPKFKFETKYFMAKTLKKMGMPLAFTDYADFSGMTGTKNLKISDVIHQAFVEVNEEGTEAAAATGVIIVRVTAVRPITRKVFNADHPFIFLIQQNCTGNILFMGRVSNPTG